MGRSVLAVLLLVLIGQPASASESEVVLGHWETTDARSVVEIYRDGDEFCGRMVSLKEPLTPEGKEKNDRHNPDEALRQSPLVGLKLVWGFKYKGDSTWTGGRVYDPDNGKTYYCKLKLKGNTLTVRGSLDRWGIAGRSVAWTRLAAGEKREPR